MDKIWLKNYPKAVAKHINLSEYASLAELFDAKVAKFAGKTAFVNFGVELSYAELDSKSRQLAAYLQQQLGLSKGDRIAIMLPNVLQ